MSFKQVLSSKLPLPLVTLSNFFIKWKNYPWDHHPPLDLKTLTAAPLQHPQLNQTKKPLFTKKTVMVLHLLFLVRHQLYPQAGFNVSLPCCLPLTEATTCHIQRIVSGPPSTFQVGHSSRRALLSKFVRLSSLCATRPHL